MGSKPGHQAVTRTGTETGTDVEPGRDRVADDGRQQKCDLPGQVGRRRQHGERRFERHSDEYHVGDGSDAGSLAQRDPQCHHDHAGQDHDNPMESPESLASP